MLKITYLLLLTFIGLYPVHTIYVSGPPSYKNKRWIKESKILYDALKNEIQSNGDEIELFPKRYYRDSIVREDKAVEPYKFLKKKEIIKSFDNLDKLMDDLVLLIFQRHKELRDDFDGLDDTIHLMAHGRGGELLLKLKDSGYAGLIKSYVVFDGDEKLYDSVSYENTSLDSSEDSVIGLALKYLDTKSNGDLVINFNMPESLEVKGNNKAEIITLVTAVVGFIAGLVALL